MRNLSTERAEANRTEFESPGKPARLPPIAAAMRRAWSAGYSLADLRSDIIAGSIVGVVALPLSMALAVASGVAPQHGLYTAIIAGAIIALLGGSKVQVSGPTAAFVVILAPISAKFGLGGLLVATMLAGVILLLLGMARMGRLIEFIPYPVTTGFTAGIAVVIATLQLRDFFGLDIAAMPQHYWEKVHALWQARASIRPHDLLIGGVTLAILLILPRLTRRIPAPIVALPIAAALPLLIAGAGIPFEVVTLRDRFPPAGVPQVAPQLGLPWMMSNPAGDPIAYRLTDFNVLRELLTAAFAIAMLGAIESLLSAVVADGMTGKKHDPDSELVAQGLGNVVAPFFGGFAATGAIARTATNIRAGAKSPIAAVTHAGFILIVMLCAAPILGYLPMAAMAAMLLIVARNMSEAKHFVHMLRVAPHRDIVVMLACFFLTVIFDMVIAVGTGVVLAALLFMGRMANAAQVQLVGPEHRELKEPLPRGVLMYQIAGPLFFGAAQRAIASLTAIADHARLVVLDMRSVPSLDATALVALESVLDKLHTRKIFCVVAGVQEEPLRLMARAGWRHRPWLVVLRDFDAAILLIRSLSASDLESDADLHGLKAAQDV